MVKQEAIMREQLGTFVFVVNAQNKLERRKIVTGMKNGAYQVVLEGLAVGERVVVEGLQKAGSGDEVKPITAQSTAPAPAQQTAPAPAQPKKADAAAAPAPEKTNATEK
jgi:membrane fusion protein (multidrug efflux system)